MTIHNKKTIYILILSFFQAILFFFLILQSASLPFVKDVEAKSFTILTGIKRLLIPSLDDKPSKSSVVFIDISNNLSNYGATNVQITDRGQILKLIKILVNHKDSVKLAFFDLLMEDTSRYDSSIFACSSSLGNKILFIKNTDDSNRVIESFDSRLPGAIATIETIGGKAINYSLITEVTGGNYFSAPTVPLAIYQCIHPARSVALASSFSNIFFSIDGHLNFRNPIIEPRVRPNDLQYIGEQSSLPIYELNNLLKLSNDKDFFKVHLANRIIIIGQLDSEKEIDKHESILGPTFGTLLVFNTFLMIENGETQLNYLWVFSFLLMFTIIAFLNIDINLRGKQGLILKKIFFVKKFAQIISQKELNKFSVGYYLKSKFIKIILGFVSWWFLLFLITAISYFVFHVLFHFFIISLLLEVETRLCRSHQLTHTA